MTDRKRDDRFGFKPPWRRYVVFCPDGRPTGWAMGVSEDSAIHHWLQVGYDPVAIGKDEIARRWEWQKKAGYTVRAVDITPAPETVQTP